MENQQPATCSSFTMNVLGISVYLLMTITILVMGYILNNIVVIGVGYFFISLAFVLSTIFGIILLRRINKRNREIDSGINTDSDKNSESENTDTAYSISEVSIV